MLSGGCGEGNSRCCEAAFTAASFGFANRLLRIDATATVAWKGVDFVSVSAEDDRVCMMFCNIHCLSCLRQRHEIVVAFVFVVETVVGSINVVSMGDGGPARHLVDR